MSNAEQVKNEHNRIASIYNNYSSTPAGEIESQLIKIALGDCTGLSVLDLGGGTGVHAREAIDLGATRVDIVDISAGMLAIGEEIERSLDRETTTRFFEADVSKPLAHLPLQDEGYDVVMANWTFSYASSMEVLEGMFRNIVGYLKPGGRFIGVRNAEIKNPALETGRYGATTKWTKEVPGGVNYLCVLLCTPPIEFEGTSLDVVHSGSPEMYERFGLTDVEILPYEQTQVVQKDPDFWTMFLERPFLAVVKAEKKYE